MSDALQELGALIELKRSDAVIATEVAFGELTVTVQLAHLEGFVEYLRDDAACRFTTLVDITAVDHPERDPRFDVVYHFLSMYQNTRIRVRVSVGEEDMVPSIAGLHMCANWQEREVFDMFGIAFEGHPDLTRILMPDDWDGHPQRKDYPLGGVPVEYHGATIPPPDTRRAYR